MEKTKASIATDIVLKQMEYIDSILQTASKAKIKEAIEVAKTLNASAADIIKEESVSLMIQQYADKVKKEVKTINKDLGILYNAE